MVTDRSGQSPVIDGTALTFNLADPAGRLAAARLRQEIGLPGPLDLDRAVGTGEPGGWELRVPLSDLRGVDRLEYLFEIEDRHGHRTTITDSANPRRVDGAFGEKSEALMPGYREPEWLAGPEAEHTETPLELSAKALGSAVTGVLWSAASLHSADPAPLLVVHDGPEFVTLGGFARYLGAAIRAGVLPPLRAALLGPGDRNTWYSANPTYARTLANNVLPALAALAPCSARIGVGVSLGALALLHAHRSHPGCFDALMLQSGSFFTPELDPQERRFPGFAAITACVAGIHQSQSDEHPVLTVLTCGTAEENLSNNRKMAATLRRLGYPVRTVEFRDAHNFTAWRDALHPHLTTLVADLIADRAA
jgi:enterochelin esterase family protein